MAKQEASPLDLVLKDFEEARQYHDGFSKQVEKRYRAYRGILDRSSKAAKWTSKYHAPYAFQIVETIVGGMMDDRTSFRVTPRPFMADLAEIEQRKKAAKTLEYLLRYEQDVDRFEEKQRPFMLQASITGLTVGKTYWKYAKDSVAPGNGPLHDDPTFEVVDVRDFFWHEAAPSLERAKFVVHRVWMTFDECKEMERRGVWRNVDKLKESRSFAEGLSSRDKALFERDRTKDQIEILEYWTDGRCITIGNRAVLLADRANPFSHGEKPFVIASSMPDLFTIPGISDVELIEELQEMLWTVGNQRLDNLALINNAIVLMRSDIDDPDAFEFAPGERWLVDDPNQVVMWTPNQLPAEISIQAESLIKGDMQTVTGGLPLTGASDQTTDQKTATGVSIITNLAQKRLAAKKANFSYAYARVAKQWIALMQQFIRDPRLIQIVGPGGDPTFLHVDPEEIQGRFGAEVNAQSDSLMRQERRAEAQAMVQVASQIAPIMQAVNQPLNMRAYVEDWLRAYDVADVERYFAAQPPQALAGGMGPEAGQQGGAPTQGAPSQPPSPTPQGAGMTSQFATAPQISPSHPSTMAPSAFMQRALAGRSGTNA